MRGQSSSPSRYCIKASCSLWIVRIRNIPTVLTLPQLAILATSLLEQFVDSSPVNMALHLDSHWLLGSAGRLLHEGMTLFPDNISFITVGAICTGYINRKVMLLCMEWFLKIAELQWFRSAIELQYKWMVLQFQSFIFQQVWGNGAGERREDNRPTLWMEFCSCVIQSKTMLSPYHFIVNVSNSGCLKRWCFTFHP